MKPKHTPGPWKVGSTIALRHRVIDGKANEVATMKGEFELEKQANAHLIAAAPEMLEALENALAWIDRSHKYGSDMESSRLSCLLDASGILSDAIKKARGAKFS